MNKNQKLELTWIGKENRPKLEPRISAKNQEKRSPAKSRVTYDYLFQHIGQLAKGMQKLARIAVPQYSVEVEAILNAQNRDSKCIESCLDGMLDFCWDDEMLALFKKLCRYYFYIDPEATTFYVHAYREMWAAPESDKVLHQKSSRAKAASRMASLSQCIKQARKAKSWGTPKRDDKD